MSDTEVSTSKANGVDNALPHGWAWITVGDTGLYINGYPFKPEDRATTGLPIIRIQNLTDESKPLNQTALEVPGEYRVNPGDMLVSWSATVDVFVWRGSTALVNQHIFRVVPAFAVIDPRLLFYWLKVAIPQLLNSEHLHGSTMKHINRGPFMAHPLPLPPLGEQVRIVEKLEEVLSDLDTGVAELEAARKKLARYRQSLLKAAVEGTLTADWRAERARRGDTFETGPQLLERILRERRARWEERQLAKFEAQGKAPPKGWQDEYPEPVEPGALEHPLPPSWAAATIDQIARVGTGSTPLRSRAEYFQGGGIPWVTSGAVNDGEVTSASDFVTEAAVRACRLETYPPDTILVAMYGEGKTRGRSATLRIPATINQALAAVVLADEAKACMAMVNVCLQGMYEKLREQASGGVQPNLNLQIVRSVEVRLPPLDEQSKIAERLSDQFDMIRMQGEAVDALLGLATAQRQNILRAAFSGRLVPQDPADEPASALLERIRAERAAGDGSTKKPRGRRKTSEPA